jgi:hypothetical protein
MGDPIVRWAPPTTRSEPWSAHRGQSELKSRSTASGLALALLIRTVPARAFVSLLEKPCSLARGYASQDFLRQCPTQQLRPTENGAQ